MNAGKKCDEVKDARMNSLFYGDNLYVLRKKKIEGVPRVVESGGRRLG